MKRKTWVVISLLMCIDFIVCDQNSDWILLWFDTDVALIVPVDINGTGTIMKSSQCPSSWYRNISGDLGHTMAADAMVYCVARSSAAMVLLIGVLIHIYIYIYMSCYEILWIELMRSDVNIFISASNMTREMYHKSKWLERSQSISRHLQISPNPTKIFWSQFQYDNRGFGYRDFNCKDRTTVRPSDLYTGNPCTSKTASLYQNEARWGLQRAKWLILTVWWNSGTNTHWCDYLLSLHDIEIFNN